MELELVLNGRRERLDTAPWRTLLEALREDFGLTGTKGYCYIGICGACTVLLDGEPVSSCILLASQANGREVTTIEGLEREGRLHPVQEAFVDHFGMQCGYCTPGMVLMAKALLDETPHPSEEEIIRFLGGNICRCTGYARIIDSVKAAVEALRASGGSSGAG